MSKQFRPASLSSVKQIFERVDSLEAILTDRIKTLEDSLVTYGVPLPNRGDQTTRTIGAARDDAGEQLTTHQEDDHPEDTEVALDFLESAAFTDNADSSHTWNLGARIATQRGDTLLAQSADQHHESGVAGHVTPWPSIIDTRNSYKTWDVFFGGHDTSQRKLQETIVLNIPPPYVLSALLAYFWNSIDAMWHVVHRPTFQAEVQQLQVFLWSNGVMPQLDPAWYALLFAILGFSSSRISKDKKLGETLGWNDNTAKQWQDQMFTGCRLAMTAADWIHQPSARILQVRSRSV